MMHGRVFTKTEDLLNVMSSGEEAIVVNIYDEYFLLYGEPTKRKEDAQKLAEGAKVLYEDMKIFTITK